MQHLRQFWRALLALFPEFVWEELTPTDIQQLGLDGRIDYDPLQRLSGLFVRWNDGSGFILMTRPLED